MPEDLDPLSPRRVDESIDDAIMSGEPPLISQRFLIDTNVWMLQDLHRIHADEHQQQQRLQRVQERLLASMAKHNRQVETPPGLFKQERQEQWYTIQQERPKHINKPRAGNWISGGLLIAAMLILLLGGFLILPEALHHSASSGSGVPTPKPPPSSTPRLQPTPTLAPHLVIPDASSGKTVYTSPTIDGISGLAWSSDSKRIISLGFEKTQIWDATTGGHVVTVDLLGKSPDGAVWSPTASLVAVGTSTQILLIDGQTGEIVRTYQLATSVVAPVSAGPGRAFSALIPASGGTGFRAITWSPDGRYIAGAVSGGASGYIQVLNARDLTPAFTLPIDGNYVTTELAWSGDGQYLAATTFYTEPSSTASQPTLVRVWKLTTHQMILQKPLGQSSGISLAFQPGHDDYLSFVNQQKFEIWNVATDSLIKSYPLTGEEPMAWSPDGHYQAYVDPKIGISIMDMQSGKVVYSYPTDQAISSTLAWSPDGRYIASTDGSSPNMVIKVWFVA